MRRDDDNPEAIKFARESRQQAEQFIASRKRVLEPYPQRLQELSELTGKPDQQLDFAVEYVARETRTDKDMVMGMFLMFYRTIDQGEKTK